MLREQILFIKNQIKLIGKQRRSDKFESRRNDALSKYTKKEHFLKPFNPLQTGCDKYMCDNIHLLHIYYNKLRESSKQHSSDDNSVSLTSLENYIKKAFAEVIQNA